LRKKCSIATALAYGVRALPTAWRAAACTRAGISGNVR